MTNGASTPFMMTAAHKKRLGALGYTDEQIHKMTPSEAHDIFAEYDAPAARPNGNGKPPEALSKIEIIERIRANFPKELQDLNQWVTWRIEERNGKLTKVPYNVNGLKESMASSVDPMTWTRFDRAINAYKNGNYDGVGFVFFEDDPYAGVDFDKCITDEVMEPQRAEWLERLDSYSEYSPSGTGAHTFVIGALPPGGRKSTEQRVEMYDQARFFTVTGDHIPGTPRKIIERDEQLKELHAEIFPKKDAPDKPKTPAQSSQTAIPSDDKELLDRMFASRNGGMIGDLWDGDTTTHNGDESAADLALCNHLAFWTGKDAQRMDRMFRQSGLMRDKWDRNARTGETYGEGTIKRAIDGTAEVYSPAQPAESAKEDPAPLSLDDVLIAIESLKDDATLTPEDRRSRVVRDLAIAIGDLDRQCRIEIAAALVAADAGFTKTDAKDFVRDCGMAAKQRQKEAKAARRAQAKAARQNGDKDAGRLTIVAHGRQLPEVSQDAIDALKAFNRADAKKPKVYVRGGGLVRIIPDEHDNHSIEQLSNPALCGIMARSARWIEVSISTEGEENETDVWPPGEVVADVLTLGHWPAFPALTGVVHCPVFDSKGRLHAEPGYDPETRIFNAGKVRLGDIKPTPANVKAAKALLLDDLLCDFPFTETASKAHALSLILQPFVRPIIEGPTPIYNIKAPARGTGKGKLAEVCSYISRGRPLSSTTVPERDEELRKRLTAIFLDGDTHILFDNVDGPINHASLASATTQPVWGDRLLGKNQSVTVPILQNWIITANNPRMSEDIARRCICISMDANVERPDQRKDFKHPNLERWTKQNRAALMTAAVTLIKLWVAKGMPRWSKRAKGSFEDWAEVMGGILAAIGVSGFLENDDELLETATSETSMMIEFIEKWAEIHQETPVTPGDLFIIASEPDDPMARKDPNPKYAGYNLLSEILGAGREHARRVQLGRLLQRYVGRVIGGHKIVRDTADKKRPRYKLVDPSKLDDAGVGHSPAGVPRDETPEDLGL